MLVDGTALLVELLKVTEYSLAVCRRLLTCSFTSSEMRYSFPGSFFRIFSFSSLRFLGLINDVVTGI